MKASEARWVEKIKPFIRLTDKAGKKKRQAETEADRPEKPRVPQSLHAFIHLQQLI